MSRPRNTGGFGLIEALVTTSVTAVLLTMLTRALSASLELSSTSLTLGGIERTACGALQSLARELRWAQPDALVITEENGSPRLDFRVSEGYDGEETVWSSTITVRYEPTGEDGNDNGIADEGRLVRVQDGVRRTLCRNVPAGGFTVALTGQRLDAALTIFGTSRNGRLLSARKASAVTLLNRTGG